MSGGGAYKWVIAGTVMIGNIMAMLDSSIVNVAPPEVNAQGMAAGAGKTSSAARGERDVHSIPWRLPRCPWGRGWGRPQPGNRIGLEGAGGNRRIRQEPESAYAQAFPESVER